MELILKGSYEVWNKENKCRKYIEKGIFRCLMEMCCDRFKEGFFKP